MKNKDILVTRHMKFYHRKRLGRREQQGPRPSNYHYLLGGIVEVVRTSAGRLVPTLAGIIVIELVFLQHGRVPGIDGISVRQVLFIFFLAVFLLSAPNWRVLWSPLSFVIIVLGIGVPGFWGLIGYLGGSQWHHVFNDANGHIYYLSFFPLFYVISNYTPSVAIRFLKIVVLFYCLVIFATYLAAVVDLGLASRIEVFLRENEFGFLNVSDAGQPYRLFLKSYPFVGIIFCISLHHMLRRQIPRLFDEVINSATFILTFAVVLLSQTRSLWVSVVLGTIIVIAFNREMISRRFVGGSLAVGAAVILLVIFTHDLSVVRLMDVDGNIAYRLVQASVLFEFIMESPWLGTGFGAVVTVDSGRGPITDFSYELDLLNLIRKVGVIGTIVYGTVLTVLMHVALTINRLAPHSDEFVYFVCTLCIVLTMGSFNPYLTSSLGIGAVTIGLAILATRYKRGAFVDD